MKILNRKFVSAVIGLLVLFIGVGVQAQESATGSEPTTAQLQQQINRLQAQVQQLQNRVERQTESEGDNTRANDSEESSGQYASSTKLDPSGAAFGLRITRQLDRGDRGPQVRQLQKLLATSDDIYPQGLVTGYFGTLTQSAVARLQERMGLPSVGQVGPQTLSRINTLLAKGAGESGVIPPGLLEAPGIQRLLSEKSRTPTSSQPTADTQTGTEIDSLPVPQRVKSQLRNVLQEARERVGESGAGGDKISNDQTNEAAADDTNDNASQQSQNQGSDDQTTGY